MFGTKLLLITLLSMYSLMVFPADKLTLITYSEVPFATQEGNNKKGLVIEFINALFKQTDLEYDIVFLPLKRGMSMAESNLNTCVLPIERNQHREVHYTWIGPVMISRYGLFSVDQSQPQLATLSDAKLASVGSFLGSGIGEYLTHFGYQVDLTNNDNLNVLVAILSWGGMRRDHGRLLFNNLEFVLELVNNLRIGIYPTRQIAYSTFQEHRANGSLPGLGIGYFTKLICFLSPNLNGYIMDQWVGKSINLLTGQNIVSITGNNWVNDNNNADTYEIFCTHIDNLALI